MRNKRPLPFLIAAVLPLLVFSWFIPKGAAQVDLWLLWLIAMLAVGLPTTLLELALARRSGQKPWQGMQSLTREADASVYWRLFAPASVALCVLLAAGLLGNLGRASVASFAFLDGVAPAAVSFALAVAALILMPLKERLGFGALFVLLGAAAAAIFGDWQGVALTPTPLGEWTLAVFMALFSVGVGTGLYWFVDPYPNDAPKSPLSAKALPIWLTQLFFGGGAFLLSATKSPPWTQAVGALGAVAIAAFLLYYATNQLRARFGLAIGAGAVAIGVLALCALPAWVLVSLVAGFGLVGAFGLAVFAGWKMKISHLRKALNFKSEWRYNVWRVAVRWLAPLAIALAFAGWAL